MNGKNKNVSNGGLGIVGVAQVVFIILKLCKLIDWEWWIVLAPLWGSAALIAGGLLLVFLVGVVIGLFKYLGVIK